MNRLSALVKGVRKIEWLAVIAALAVLLLLFLRSNRVGAEVYEGTELEMRLQRTLSSIGGAGRVRVLVNEKQTVAAFSGGGGEKEITGVVIVAEGAKDLRVALALEQAAKTLLNVELNQIQVLEMEDSYGAR